MSIGSPASRRLERPGMPQRYLLAVALVLMAAMALVSSRAMVEPYQHAPSMRRQLEILPSLAVFGTASDLAIAKKQRQDLELVLEGDQVALETSILTLDEQRSFVQSHDCGPAALQRFDDLRKRQQEHLAIEVFKYCALSSSSDGGLWIDSSSPLLLRLQSFLQADAPSMAVLGDDYFRSTIHGSLLYLTAKQLPVAENMLSVLVETSMDVLEANPLLLPRTLYSLLAVDQPEKQLRPGANGPWVLLQLHCHADPLARDENPVVSLTDDNSYRLAHHCPQVSGFCCSVVDGERHQVVLMTRHPLLPYQTIVEDTLRRPYNAETGHFEEEELPFISTIQAQVIARPDDWPPTPNFFDTLLRNHCLPDQDQCTKCLREKKGSNCDRCGEVCSCYCQALCHETVADKFVAKKLTVSPPLYSRDPNRLVPRIVHQTWFEPLTKEKYPNMSRLVESFRKSGWEYKFYSDAEAASFLSTHFPAEVREAYDALRPGAFKADLFRYCALLIHGGVYADVDILLESNLDIAVAPDVGFMVPVDEPGRAVNHRMCLWNGLIAAAPGHPYLIKAIETVVNQVRNRFTAVDTDATFCPNPELSVLHAFDTLFTAGPCLLGASINRVTGRNGQASFEAGELDTQSATGATFVLGAENPSTRIPGRTIILQQNKWDMGAHRFTWLENNLVVAATDLPDSDDRKNQAVQSSGASEHYSKTHAKTGIYGLNGLYTDQHQADEDIKLYLDASRLSTKTIVAVSA